MPQGRRATLLLQMLAGTLALLQRPHVLGGMGREARVVTRGEKQQWYWMRAYGALAVLRRSRGMPYDPPPALLLSLWGYH